MSGIDVVVMAAYFAAVLAVGAYFARSQRDATDYFLGRHSLPWWAVMLSIVATETSALTVISIPAVSARGDLTFLQLTLGYLIGRVAIAVWLLPGYFTGEQETAYARLESRFGPNTRKTASAVFMSVRALGDSVRVYVAAIPLAVVTHWSILTSVVVISLATLAYTWAGGIKAVIWVDVMQMGLYVVAGIATIAVAASLAGGISNSLSAALAEGKLRVIDWQLSFSTTYTFAGGMIGGALLSAASHGTDHLIVQRLLATRALGDARRALVGTLLLAEGADDGSLPGDYVFPTFVVNHLPAGLSGLVVAGMLAAAMSTVSSSLNSLASAVTHDFYAPLTGRRDPRHLLGVGRWATLAWAVVLAGGALVFPSPDQPVVELALSFASIAYGGLLGTYILSGLYARAGGADAILGMVVSTGTVLVIFFADSGPFANLAWPWLVPIGTVITLAVASVSTLVRTAWSER